VSDERPDEWYDAMNQLTDDIVEAVDGQHISYQQLAERLTDMGYRRITGGEDIRRSTR
jgi:hypothetical protein